MIGEHQIYVVDQDSSARKGLVRLLAKAGYDVVGCDSLAAYLAMFKDQLTGCLVLDAMTSVSMNGTWLEAVAARGYPASVIVISADDDPVSKNRARAMKAEAFFRKPVDGVALLDAIRWSLR